MKSTTSALDRADRSRERGCDRVGRSRRLATAGKYAQAIPETQPWHAGSPEIAISGTGFCSAASSFIGEGGTSPGGTTVKLFPPSWATNAVQRHLWGAMSDGIPNARHAAGSVDTKSTGTVGRGGYWAASTPLGDETPGPAVRQPSSFRLAVAW